MDTPGALSADNLARINFLFDNDLYDLPDAQRPDCHKDGTTYRASLRTSSLGETVLDRDDRV